MAKSKIPVKAIIAIVAAVVIAICVIFGVSSAGASGAKRAFKSYVTSIAVKSDYKKYKKFIPKAQIKEREATIEEYGYYDSYDEFLKDDFKQAAEDMESSYGEHIKIDFEFGKVKAYSNKKLDKIGDDFPNALMLVDKTDLVKYKKIAVADVKWTISGDKDEEEYEDTVILVRESGRWKIYDCIF